MGWQPSRFLADRAEAERTFALADRLGSVNAAAAELGTTWPSLRKAFQRHGWGCPPATPKRSGSVRSPRLASARAAGRPGPGSGVVALNSGALPARERPAAELHDWVHRDEEYTTLGANVVVELNSESRARQPTSRAWAIIRRADRAHRLAGQRTSRLDVARPTELTAPADPINFRSDRRWPMPAAPAAPPAGQPIAGATPCI